MPVGTALRVRLPNRPGELARVAGQLGNAGVNIQSVAGVVSDDEGVVELMADDLDRAAAVLQDAGVSVQRVQVLVQPVSERFASTPGTLAQAAGALAAEGINIESIYLLPGGPTGVQVVLGCDRPERAEQLVSPMAMA
jgi:hypothetical protein